MTGHMVPVFLSLASILVVRAILVRWRRRQKLRRLGCQAPRRYPHRLPWILDPWGSDLKRRRLEGIAKGRYNRLFQEQFLECGPTFEERSPHGALLCTTDAENWRTILSLKADDYIKEEMREGPMLRFIGPGILTNEGAAWRRSRDLIKPLFVRAELNDVDRFERHVDRLLHVIPRDGQTVDLMPWMTKLVCPLCALSDASPGIGRHRGWGGGKMGPPHLFPILIESFSVDKPPLLLFLLLTELAQFLDSGTEFIFGQSFDCLAGKSAQAEEMVATFKECRRSLGKSRIVGARLPFFRDTEFEKNVEIFHAFVDRQVARALDRARDSHDAGALGDRSRHHYVLLDELAKVAPDPVMLRFEMLHVFIPAFQSISNVFSLVLFYLARRPDVWADLRGQALALGDEPVTFELLKSLHSFRNVIYEGLRMHGSSGRLSRTAIRDTVVPRGGGADGMSPVLVPKGQRVMLELYAKLNDPAVWGDDAHEFRPSRFEGRRLRWDFMAFSGGPRICPAQQQVITQTIYLLVRLAREFEVLENRDPCLEYVESFSLVSESKNGVQVALHENRGTVV